MIHWRDRPIPFGPSPVGSATLVASTHQSRFALMARPVSSSEWPSVYWSAVSMKLMPASRALATIRAAVASSVGPPNIIVPRQIGETLTPLRPRLRYSMVAPAFPKRPARRLWPLRFTKPRTAQPDEFALDDSTRPGMQSAGHDRPGRRRP